MKINRKAFFTLFRASFGKLSQEQVDGLEEFMGMVEDDNRLVLYSELAYVFATVYHETAYTFRPVREAYWLSEGWRERNLRYYPWYGRGYVQITWKENYERLGKILGVDLITDPDTTMVPQIAYEILIVGMLQGLFTGKKLSDYIKPGEVNYKEARRVVNGLDRASEIGWIAEKFENIIKGSIGPFDIIGGEWDNSEDHYNADDYDEDDGYDDDTITPCNVLEETDWDDLDNLDLETFTPVLLERLADLFTKLADKARNNS